MLAEKNTFRQIHLVYMFANAVPYQSVDGFEFDPPTPLAFGFYFGPALAAFLMSLPGAPQIRCPFPCVLDNFFSSLFDCSFRGMLCTLCVAVVQLLAD